MLTRPPFPSGWSSLPISPSNLTLANTLPVGQSFLWHRHELPVAGPSSQPRISEEFSRGINDPPRVVCLRQSLTELFYTAVHPSYEAAEQDHRTGQTTRWVQDYFQLDRYPSLENMYADWRERDPGLFGKTELDSRAIGVRVLRQDPWECLIAFITSTNNHISRITSLMHRLSHTFAPSVLDLETPDGSRITSYHPFPPSHSLPIKLEAILRDMGFGYRANFIQASLATLRAEFGEKPGDVENGLHVWRTTGVDEVRQKLLVLKGVGRKVADCVMLMCLDQPSLIPVDTHVAAIAARHPSFPSRLRNKPMSKEYYNDVQGFLLEKWGPLGGWCQAVMFAADLPPTTVRWTPESLVAPISNPLCTEAPSNFEHKYKGTPITSPSKRNFVPTIASDMPAAYGFKRTRSATKIQLARSSVAAGNAVTKQEAD